MIRQGSITLKDVYGAISGSLTRAGECRGPRWGEDGNVLARPAAAAGLLRPALEERRLASERGLQDSIASNATGMPAVSESVLRGQPPLRRL